MLLKESSLYLDLIIPTTRVAVHERSDSTAVYPHARNRPRYQLAFSALRTFCRQEIVHCLPPVAHHEMKYQKEEIFFISYLQNITFLDYIHILDKNSVEISVTMISQQQLETIGLPEQEAVIYHSLLHHGPMGLQTIAHTTGIRRTTLYPYIQSLIKKGIVASSTKGKRTVYSAKTPEGFLRQLNEQRYLLEAMLPQIAQLLQFEKSRQSIITYQNIEELKAGFQNIILNGDQKQELLSIEGDIQNMYRMGLSFWKDILDQKKKRGIKSRSLIADDEKTEFILHDHPIQLRITSILRGFNICLYLRGEQILLFVPSQGMGWLMINPVIAPSLKLLFEALWKKGKSVQL